MRLSTFMVYVFVAVAGPRLAAGQARVEDAPPSNARLRALIWLPAETDGLLDRVRGQTNDLGVDLFVNAIDPLPTDRQGQLQGAYTLSERHEATLVIWFAKQPDPECHFVVNIAIPGTHRLLTRDLGPSSVDSTGLGISSAVIEGAALIVRAAIQAVLNGATIGEVHQAPFERPSEAPAPSATPAIRSAAPGKAERQPIHQSPRSIALTSEAWKSDARARGDWPWAVGLELFVPYDGVGDNGIANCGSLRLERRSGPLLAFVMGGGCLTRNLGVATGTISVGRQQAVVGANAILWDRDPQISVGAQIGAVFYERRTLHFPLGTSLASRVHALGVAGPEIRLLIPHGGSRLSASVSAGVDLLSSSVIFSYRGPLGLPTDQANRVQPYGTLGLAYRF